MKVKQTFPCTTEGLVGCQKLLASVCEDPKPQIITDEIVSNIVRCSGSADFDIEIDFDGEKLTIVYTDRGVAFDPTRAAPPNLDATLEDRSIGGLGLFMVKKMSQSVVYARRGDENVLKIVI